MRKVWIENLCGHWNGTAFVGFCRFKAEETKKETAMTVLVLRLCINDHVWYVFFGPALRVPTCKATKSPYLQSHVLDSRVEPSHGKSSAGVWPRNGAFTKACRKAARNRENKSWMEVCLTEEVDCRDGGIDVTEQKLQAMLLELGFHDGRVKWDSFSECFSVSAKWPVADATGPKEPSPERAGGTCITCTICQEHCPAAVLMPCGHVVCRDCQHCQQLRQCPMCRGPVSSASDGLFMDWEPRPCCRAVGGGSSLRWKLQAWWLWPSFVVRGVQTHAYLKLHALSCQVSTMILNWSLWNCLFLYWTVNVLLILSLNPAGSFVCFPSKNWTVNWNSYRLRVALAVRNLHFTWPPSNYQCSLRGIVVWWPT